MESGWGQGLHLDCNPDHLNSVDLLLYVCGISSLDIIAISTKRPNVCLLLKEMRPFGTRQSFPLPPITHQLLHWVRLLTKFWGQKWSCQFNQLSQALEKIQNIFSLTGCETFQRGFLLANGSFHGFSNFL